MIEFPELVELRASQEEDPQLLLLGIEILGNKIYAPGYITLGDAIPEGVVFQWEQWEFKLGESLPAKKACIVPLQLDKPIELEITKWPQTKS